MSEKTVKHSSDNDGTVRLCLVVRQQGEATLVPLPHQVPLVIGRAAPADVIIADETLSRSHARFSWGDEGVWVEDLGSLNGTRIAGQRIKGRALLSPGGEAVLGNVVVSVHEQTPSRGSIPVVEEEGFDSWLEDALARSQKADQKVALLMVRTARKTPDHFHREVADAASHLVGWDHLGVYGHGYLVAARIGANYPQAEQAARSLTTQLAEVGVAVAVFPEAGQRVDRLIELLRELVRETSTTSPWLSARTVAPAHQPANSDIVVSSPKMVATFEAARRMASSRAPILIIGETGTGKEVIAQRIVQDSPRAGKPLVAVNCGALVPSLVESSLFGHVRGAFTGADRTTKGVFEEAQGGTVFLDEVAELPLLAQASLLRVLESGRLMRVGATAEIAVDVRVIAATNRDVDAMVAEGKLRADLLYRLNTLTLKVPPLRERPEDIVPLAQSFLQRAATAEKRTLTLSQEVKAALMAYAWPGNVRELRNVIERLAIMADGDEIDADALPTLVRLGQASDSAIGLPTPSDLREQIRAYETKLILDALRTKNWNQTEAARVLNLPIRTLTHKIMQLGLKKHFP